MASYTLDDLLYLMSRLRDPDDGCPWDKKQDFASIVPHTIEESYELADAIERGDLKQVREELGDVLFQVVFYSQLGQEQGEFAFHDVVAGLVEKLLRRHPHVFPSGELSSRAGEQAIDSAQVNHNWEVIKSQERQHKSQSGVLDDIPTGFAALTRAAKLQKRAARTGFDWRQVTGALHKLTEEVNELTTAIEQAERDQMEQELGDVLFSCVNVARHINVDAEAALRRTNRKFEARFRFIEKQALAKGLTLEDMSLDQMDELWDKAKQQGL